MQSTVANAPTDLTHLRAGPPSRRALWLLMLGVLLVLKFVSSVVSKLLLSAVFAGVVWLGFTQRDSLSACIAEIQTRVEQGDTSDITCSFFGRDVSVEIPFQQ